jgi:hypothetical protein
MDSLARIRPAGLRRSVHWLQSSNGVKRIFRRTKSLPDIWTGGKVYRTRPVCAFPKTAVYKGSGSIYDAASFERVNP